MKRRLVFPDTELGNLARVCLLRELTKSGKDSPRVRRKVAQQIAFHVLDERLIEDKPAPAIRPRRRAAKVMPHNPWPSIEPGVHSRDYRPAKTWLEIGQAMGGISRQRVQQIYLRAMRKLRARPMLVNRAREMAEAKAQLRGESYWAEIERM